MHPRNPPHIAAFLNHQPEIDETAFVAPTAAVIGAVRIGAGSSIWYQVTLRGDNNFITIFICPYVVTKLTWILNTILIHIIKPILIIISIVIC